MPSVVTVHDMIPEQFPDLFFDADLHIQSKRQCMEQSRIIIAISHATAAQVRAFYPELASKIRVIHHGADHLTQPRHPLISAGECRSVLFVGDRENYKNFRSVLEAMTCKEWPVRISLRVVGRPFSYAEQLLVQRLGLESRVTHLGRLSDDALAEEYRRCSCCVYPSLEEGFGFPTLEAQAMGSPIACSDRPVFREIGGEAAEFFDPRLPESIAAGVARAIEPHRRTELIAAGQENARRFRWDDCAEQTIRAYEDALK